MTEAQPAPEIETAGELLAYAYQMELEAQERYQYLAEQMRTHNNIELATLFGELARVEGLHAADIREQMKSFEVPEIPDDYKWSGAEGPETLDLGDMHYLMTPRLALLLALKAEQTAHDFFKHILEVTNDSEIKHFAAEFAEEEQEHVDLVHKELEKYPETSGVARDDLDPPISQG